MSRKIRVMVADDHTLVRQGIRSLLEAFDEIDVIGEAENGVQAVDLAAELSPDVVLMDVNMPVMNGMDAMREISRRGLDCKVLVISIFDNQEYVVDVMRSGAKGYILKDVSATEMLNAVKSIFDGGTYFSATVTESLLSPEPTESETERFSLPLTPRELEILKLIARGKSAKEIARELDISVRTAETHRQNVRRKLDARNAAELTMIAVRHGLVRPETDA